MISAEAIGRLLAEASSAWSIGEVDLAARAGLDRDTIRAALRGDADLSALAALARALGGTVDDLFAGTRFWEAPAAAFKSAGPGVELSLVRAALLQLSSVARDRAAIADILGLGRNAGKAGLDPEPLAEDITAQAEELAARTRHALGLSTEPIMSVREAMRRLGIASFLTDAFGTEKIDGVIWRDAEGRAYAAANARARRGKLTALRMTFAHELCHALFDGTKLAAIGVLEHRTERAEGLEQRANAFAAHFLAPRAAVRRFLSERGLRSGEKPSAVHVRSLSEHFVMGVEAVASHLVSCGVWAKSDIHRHRELVTHDVAGEDNAELSPTPAEAIVPIERRGELLELATLALERGEITVGRWRELLGVSPFDAWRRLLDEQQVTIDVEQRTAV